MMNPTQIETHRTPRRIRIGDELVGDGIIDGGS